MTRLYKLDAVCNRLATLGAKKPMLTVRHLTLHSLGTIETEKECCRTKRENRQSVGVVSCELSRDHFCVFPTLLHTALHVWQAEPVILESLLLFHLFHHVSSLHQIVSRLVHLGSFVYSVYS